MGVTKVTNKLFDSLILLEESQFKDLLTLCEFRIDLEWNLIYRASKYEFEGPNFNTKCDNKPNTFVIIKSENGNVFDDYTEQSWSGNQKKLDRNAFIFSFINQQNRPIKN